VAYISQWARNFGVDLNTMKYRLDNHAEFRPNFSQALDLLKTNFDVNSLKTSDEVLNAVKNNYPVFVLLDWGNRSGHCVVLEWDSVNNSLSAYDSVDDSHTQIKVGDGIYSKIKYFYRVNGPNYGGL
jgi:hypothetical protein